MGSQRRVLHEHSEDQEKQMIRTLGSALWVGSASLGHCDEDPEGPS